MARAKETTPITVTVCGAGNASHVLAGLVSTRKSTTLNILVLETDEAEEWSKAAKAGDFIISSYDSEMKMQDNKVKLKTITSDPERALKKSDIVILAVPVSSFTKYLEAITPHVVPNMSIVGFPGMLGFEFEVYDILKTKAKKCSVININSQPWAGRIVEFGKSVKILSREEIVTLSIVKGSAKNGHDPVQVLQYIFGELPELSLFNNFMEATLNIKIIMNATIMYSKWHKWDGKPLAKKPLFYKELTDEGAKILSEVSDEILMATKEITKHNSKLELPNVVGIFEILQFEYKYNIDDNSNLLQAIKTNTAFGNYMHPVEETEDGKFVPDFSHRFITEDVPYGLVVLKGICQLTKVKTPTLDKVITWAQEKLEKEFIVGSKLEGKDLKETRAPQKYGFKTIDDLVKII